MLASDIVDALFDYVIDRHGIGQIDLMPQKAVDFLHQEWEKIVERILYEHDRRQQRSN